MTDNSSAKQPEIDVETLLDDDIDESVVSDRQPRAPSLQRLGRYRLVRELASGGMATVNLAVTEGLDKLVALKIIHPHLAKEESFVRMFLDEARLASAISHRNVCNVFDFGETDGCFYIAMDYLAGQSLRDVLRRLKKAALPIEPRKLAVYIAYMMAEACEGLHAAHELHGADGQPLHVVHRDVSPHNLFVTYDGNVSVVDFGIARASDRIQSTATGVLKGKFSYMAPEQMRQLEIDRRADVWALGVVLWESLTLQRLFVRSSQADTVMSVMMDRVRPPSEINPDLPKELDAIVLRSIVRAPSQRYATARDMGRDLTKFCRESGVTVGPIEIEHLMERLFEAEIAASKQLLRKAKQNASEAPGWVDVTPSGFGRVSRSSGAIEKGKWNSGAPPVDVVNDSTPSTALRIPSISATAPAALARSTAHTELTDLDPPTKKKPLALLAAVAACALVFGTWLVVGKNEESSAKIASVPAAPEFLEAPAGSAPQTGVLAVGEQAQPSEALEPSVTSLPAPVQPPPVAPLRSTPPRPETTRRAPARPLARGSASSQSAQRESEADGSSPSHATGSEELSLRGSEAAAVGSAHGRAQEEREDSSTPHAAQAPAVPVPAPQAVAVAPAPAKPAAVPVPSGPQRLDAQPAVADLDVDGSLGSGIVSRLLTRSLGALKSCYVEAAKRAGRNDFSSMSISLMIDEGGAVRDVSASKHGLSDLSSCASAALKRMRSDRVPDVGTVHVKFRLTFKP
jgi:eukaryotic-like serine/threonine-protein kinase